MELPSRIWPTTLQRLRGLLVLALVAGWTMVASLGTAHAARRTPDTIFGARSPRVPAVHRRRPVEVGVRFRSRVTGKVTGIRFYKGAGNTGRHVGSLWTGRGRLIARARFRHETASGWQSVRFARPVPIAAGTTYLAGYHAPRGHYSLTRHGLATFAPRGPLIVAGRATRRGDLYRYGRAARRPRHVRHAANFWVDVIFVPKSRATTASGHPPPTNSGTTSSPTSNPPTGTSSPPSSPASDCFARPGACGFPDPSYQWDSATAWQPGGGGVGPNDGVAEIACSALPSSGSITTSGDGEVIKDLNVTGTIQVTNRNVTIENVCVTNNGSATLGSDAIKVLSSGLTVENSTIAGANDSSESVEQAITNFGGGTVTLSHDRVYNCGECLNTGSWKVNDSYILNNGMYGTSDHLEAIYVEGSGDTVSVTHSTVLSPPGWNGPGSPQGGQAGLFFGDTNGGGGGACSTNWSITDNLLAGDGVLIYECGNSSSVGTAALAFTGNRIAACTGSTYTDSQGFAECSGIPAQDGGDTDRSGDGFGYFPNGGLKGTDIATYCAAGSTTWADNVNENTGAVVGCG